MIYSLDNVKKEPLVNRIKSLFSVNHNLVVNGLSSYVMPHDYSAFKEFKQLVNEIHLILPKYKIVDMWFNIYTKGGYVKKHNHTSEATSKNSWLCGVYNLHKPLNSGDFYLNDNKIEAQEGDFITFLPKDNHYTTENQNNDIRIVISFNFMKEISEFPGDDFPSK